MTSCSGDHRGPFSAARPPTKEATAQPSVRVTGQKGDAFLAEMEAAVAHMDPSARPPPQRQRARATVRTSAQTHVAESYVQRIAATAEAYRQKLQQQAAPPAPSATAASARRRERTLPPRGDIPDRREDADEPFVQSSSSSSSSSSSATIVSARLQSAPLACEESTWSAPLTGLARLALAAESSSESSDSSDSSDSLEFNDDARSPDVSAIELVTAPTEPVQMYATSPLLPAEAVAHPPRHMSRLMIGNTGHYLLVEEVHDAYATTCDANDAAWFMI